MSADQHQARYHHGDLPNALRRAAAEVIGERGVGGFSLREVARRAGVSHAAPAHHFGDVRGLLTSLAAEGFEHLHRVTAEAAAGSDDPVEQLQAIGEAYVGLARVLPAHFQVMFRRDIVDTDDPHLIERGIAAYGVLEGAVQRLIEREGLHVPLDDAAWMCWSATQGLVVLEEKLSLITEARLEPPIATGELMRRFTVLLVAGMRGAPAPS